MGIEELDHDTLQLCIGKSNPALAVRSLDEIRDRFYGTCRNAEDSDTTDTMVVDVEDPEPGELFGYLVVGVSPSGAHGLAGLDSDGKERDLRAKDCP